MMSVVRLDGLIYHMVHFDNLRSIFLRRALLSKDKMRSEGLEYRSIAFEDVQNLRDRVLVWDFAIGRYRRLHSYVPFYFAAHTPMQYVQYRKGVQNETILFEVSRSVLKDPGVLFTDGNASNQQLSQSMGERVGIKPATALNSPCSRKYHPGGPYGTNSSRSNFYSNLDCLDLLNWSIIDDRWFDESEKKRIKHAEVLVPDLLPLGRVQGISVKTREMEQSVNEVIAQCELTGRVPSAVCKPGLYF